MGKSAYLFGCAHRMCLANRLSTPQRMNWVFLSIVSADCLEIGNTIFFLNVPIKVAINGTIPYVFRHAHILLRQRYPIILKFWFWWPLNWVSHWKNSISGAIKAKLGFKFSKWSPSLSLVYDVRRVPNLRWLSFYYPNIHPSTGVNT